MNTLTPEMHQDSNFSHLYEALAKRIKENPSSPQAETKNDAFSSAESSQPGEHVNATNGSIGVGKIHVGGNVDGNIIIGNNNQVNNDRKK
jgi:hypothetical protein